MSSFCNNVLATKLHAKVKGVDGRGGSTIVEMNDQIIMFGGADRGMSAAEPTHFQDVINYTKTQNGKISCFQSIVTNGDIPMARQSHSVVAYGKYMLLFGGTVYSHKEEDSGAYNDIYIFCTETNTWGYVGEAGVEPLARGSHSMGIVYNPNSAIQNRKYYLVIYGGSSSEGVLNDTVYAELPPVESIDINTIHIEWKLLCTSPTTSDRPNIPLCTHYDHGREMAGSCCHAGRMYVSGGRHGNEEEMRLFSDVWELRVNEAYDVNTVSGTLEVTRGLEGEGESKSNEILSVSFHGMTVRPPVDATHSVAATQNDESLTASATTPAPQLVDVFNTTARDPILPVAQQNRVENAPQSPQNSSSHTESPLIWRRRMDLELPSPRCSHGVCVVVIDNIPTMQVYGGYNLQGLRNDLISTSLSVNVSDAECASQSSATVWKDNLLSANIDSRIGLCMCSISNGMLNDLLTNKLYQPVLAKVTSRVITRQSQVTVGTVEPAAVVSDSEPVAMLMFGGLNQDNDFGDVWLFTF